jgi:hypothetical protein
MNDNSKYVGGSASIKWYSESTNYANYKSKNGGFICHYTTMIWKMIESVGFGLCQRDQTSMGLKGQ